MSKPHRRVKRQTTAVPRSTEATVAVKLSDVPLKQTVEHVEQVEQKAETPTEEPKKRATSHGMRCPKCKSRNVRIRKTRTHRPYPSFVQKTFVRTRYATCEHCEHTFKGTETITPEG